MIDVTLFDPHLEFRRDLAPNRRLLGKATYQVGLDGSLYVMKIVSTDEAYKTDLKELEQERRVLTRARGIDNITNLLNFYSHVEEYVAILKEYAAGDILKGLNRPFDKNKVVRRLSDIIAEFHERGIACLDINKGNIVISPDGKRGTIIDLNIAYFREDCTTVEFFERLKQEDYADLKRAFRQTKN